MEKEKDFLKEEEEKSKESEDSEEEDKEPGVLITGARLDFLVTERQTKLKW